MRTSLDGEVMQLISCVCSLTCAGELCELCMWAERSCSSHTYTLLGRSCLTAMKELDKVLWYERDNGVKAVDKANNPFPAMQPWGFHWALLSGNFLSQRFYACLCIQPWMDKCVQLFEGVDPLLIGKICSGSDYCSTAELPYSVTLFYPCCLTVPLDALVSWWIPCSASLFSLFVIDLSKVQLLSPGFCVLIFPFRSRHLERVCLSPQ